MFIEIDYNKRPQKSKLHLAKPNKQIIGVIHEKFNDTVKLRLGEINELNFSIPYTIEKDGEMVYNSNVDKIMEKMLIKLTLGVYEEWYIVNSIEDDAEDDDTMNVKAYSLGYELSDKKSPVFSSEEDEVYNARQALEKVLEKTVWRIEYIDPTFEEMYRSLSIEKETSVLDAIMTMVETYGAVAEWDTINRKVSFKMMEKIGKFRGMTVNYGRLLRSLKRTRTTDELVTRLRIEGAEGMTIHSVNPTGQGYIEDFSYFMYPFERDEDKRVIKQSLMMSDALCHAILDHKESLEKYSPQIMKLQDDLSLLEVKQITQQSKLESLGLELENILTLLDIAKKTEDESLINQRTKEKLQKESEIQAQQLVIAGIREDMANAIQRIEDLQKTIEEDAGFTEELLHELNLYTYERDWKDDRYIDVNELFQDGQKEFERLRKPKVVLDVNIDNLLNIVEEQYYWDKLVIGDRMKVKYPQMDIEYTATIIEIEYNLEENEANVVVANTKDLLSSSDKLLQLISKSYTAVSLIENNKYKWDKINAVEKEVNAIITQEWDANKNRITAGVNNTIEVGSRGIIVRDPMFPNEMLIIQAGIFALSEDGGETWKTAIRPSGIVAERLIGRIIAGQELIITNGSGSFTMDANGFRVRGTDFVVENSSGDKNLVDEWNKTGDFVEDFRDDNIITHYEKDKLKEQWTVYDVQYNMTVQLLNSYFEDQGNSNPEIVKLHQKYEELFNYLFIENQTDGMPLLSNESSDKSTRIDRVIFEQRWNGYRNQFPIVQNIIQLQAKNLADSALEEADEAKKNIEEVMNDVVYKVEIESSKGTTFKNNNIDTTLTARVYRGKENITSTLPNTAFMWKKYDKDGILDTAWVTKNTGIGNVVVVTSADVHQKSIFSCDINID